MTLQCRVCGGVIYNTKAKNLFQKENFKLLLNVELVVGTLLVNDPELPRCICACCLHDLNQAIVFRNLCIQTQQKLLEKRRSRTPLEFASDYDVDREMKREIQMDTELAVMSAGNMNDSNENVEELLDPEEDDDDPLSENHGESEDIAQDLSGSSNGGSSPSPRPKKVATATTPAGTAKSTRRRYVTWNNLTEEEIVERKRQQRRRDCVCEQCGRHFTDQSNFKLHMLRHTGIKNFACPDCGKKFYTEHLLSLHLRIEHRGEKPYACKYCNKTFKNSTPRTIHERIHTKVRPYPCYYCSKSFSAPQIRKEHELKHNGVRAFFCETCDLTFKRKTHLTVHLKSKAHVMRAKNKDFPSTEKV
ncbi:transcription factor Ouib-like isoform X1 [Drosophila guanche]|uniref:Blast:Zinc finger protein 214 n=2 Tax=Drosophila guanche TaxID=7266 RepID=A0A3B0JQ76_DROGU|nr:transcription factor Ouib-like isoform X1 [Drosophila guanche]SPP84275.1 blast:Zinc finger protein 214 [Drosophila guanche]